MTPQEYIALVKAPHRKRYYFGWGALGAVFFTVLMNGFLFFTGSFVAKPVHYHEIVSTLITLGVGLGLSTIIGAITYDSAYRAYLRQHVEAEAFPGDILAVSVQIGLRPGKVKAVIQLYEANRIDDSDEANF